MTENSLAIFTRASQMLVEANTIQEVKELKDLALTAAEWAKRKGMGEEAVQHCRAYALRAEIKLGEMLQQTERAKGIEGKPGPGKGKRGDMALPRLPEDPPTLSELGITKRESSEAQRLASLPKEKQEEIIEGKKSVTQANREIARAQAKAVLEKNAMELPRDKFQVILADPPWKYDFSETESREIENQYPTMDLEEICSMNIPSADDSVLFLWATAPKLREALTVIEAWRFKYVTNAVWDKEKIGMGYWFRGQHELLLVGTKGKIQPPAPDERVSSVIRETRKGHSEKPTKVYEIIEAMFPKLKKVELFSRSNRKGWTHWGNQI